MIAIDSDGSLLLDTSSLVTLADVNPPNLLALVFVIKRMRTWAPPLRPEGPISPRWRRARALKKP